MRNGAEGSRRDFFTFLESLFPKDELGIRSFQKLATYTAFAMKDRANIVREFGHWLTVNTFNVIRQQEHLKDFDKNVKNFWNRQVSRATPGLDKMGKLINKEAVERPDKTIVSDYGSFCEQVQSSEPFDVSALVAASLDAMVHRRREITNEFENGKTHVALPDRPDGKYWVTLVISNKAIKIPVTKDEIISASESPSAFQQVMQDRIAESVDSGAGWIDWAEYVKKNKATREAQAYGGKALTDRQVNGHLAKQEEVDVADLRIVLNSDERSTIPMVQDNPDAYTGTGTGVVLCVGTNTDQASGRECSGVVTAKFAHSKTDGANGLDELAWSVNQAVKLSRLNRGAPALSFGTDVPDPKTFEDSRELPPVHVGGVVLERAQKTSPDAGASSYAECVDKIYAYYKKNYRVKITWSMLETLAAMLTVGAETMHFLEAVGQDKTLGVSLAQCTKDIQSQISSGETDPALLKVFLAELALWQTDSADAKLGKGLVTVFSVLSQGWKRNIIQGLTNITDPGKVQMLTDTFLFSGFSTKDGYRPSSIRNNSESVVDVVGFTTANSDVYSPGKNAVFGAVDRGDGSVMVSIRDHTPDGRHRKNFEDNYQKNFKQLLKYLMPKPEKK